MGRKRGNNMTNKQPEQTTIPATVTQIAQAQQPRYVPKYSAPATEQKACITPIKLTGAVTPKAPIVRYTPHVQKVIHTLVQRCGKEVGWLGTVQKTADGYLIDAIYVPEQVVSGTETDIDNDALGALALEIMDQGKDPGTLYYWGHSHVNMGVGPSGQDERQVAEYLDNCPVFIREIRNKAGASKVDVYDVNAGVVFQCVTTEVQQSSDDSAFYKQMDELIKANVKERVYQSGNYTYPNGYFNTGKEGKGEGLRSAHNTKNGKKEEISSARLALLSKVTFFDHVNWVYIFEDGYRQSIARFSAEEMEVMDKAIELREQHELVGYSHGYN